MNTSIAKGKPRESRENNIPSTLLPIHPPTAINGYFISLPIPYYLHQGKTKTGKPKYFFSMKSEGNLVNTIPEGYEIYENPNAQVFLRKIRRQIVTPQEVDTVQAGVKRYAKIEHYIVDVKGKHIVVYLCDQNVDALVAITALGLGGDRAKMQETLLRSVTYSPMMQFVLEDEKTREYRVERWCFRGSVDDWIRLDSGCDLKALIKKYAPHLGIRLKIKYPWNEFRLRSTLDTSRLSEVETGLTGTLFKRTSLRSRIFL